MLDFLQTGGWLMVPILLCSLFAATIAMERWWALRRSRVLPQNLSAATLAKLRSAGLNKGEVDALATGSPLGQVLAAGIANADLGRERIAEAMREAVDHASHELQRYLTSLGIVASIAPLLGLLGTVMGMIEVFTALDVQGAGNAGALSGGIAEALITTAAGLSVAIPSLICHRYFLRRVDDLAHHMEREAGKLTDVLQGAFGNGQST